MYKSVVWTCEYVPSIVRPPRPSVQALLVGVRARVAVCVQRCLRQRPPFSMTQLLRHP
jgi:hypothetical protein